MTTIILDDVKQSLAINLEEHGFDLELLNLINTSWSEVLLSGLNVEWDDVIVTDTVWPELPTILLSGMIKTVVILKVRRAFSPTASATIESSFNAVLDRLEFLIGVEFAKLIDEEV